MEEVERHALGGEYRPLRTATCDHPAVPQRLLKLRAPAQRRVDLGTRPRHAQPGDHARRLLGEHRAPGRVLGNEDARGRVARADVLGQSGVDQLEHVAREATGARYLGEGMSGERRRLGGVVACALTAIALLLAPRPRRPWIRE